MKILTSIIHWALSFVASFIILASVAKLSAQPAESSAAVTVPTASWDGPESLPASDWEGIRAAYEAGRHAFSAIDGGWEARNPGQQWRTVFDDRGFVAQPNAGGWTWGLELRSYGFAGSEHDLSGTPVVKVDGHRLSYQRDAGIEEWFVNDLRGLEHGFTVTQRPEGAEDAPLQFDLTIRGGLRAQICPTGRDVSFQNAAGKVALNYAGLKVWDADGRTLPAHFVLRAEDQIRLIVDESGASYPITVDPIAQQAYLKPAAVGTTQAGDQFGYSVAVSGHVAVVGAPFEDSLSTGGVNTTPNDNSGGEGGNSGAAYIFVRNGTTWTQQAFLKPFGVDTGRAYKFGSSVAISGDTVLIGAPESVSNLSGNPNAGAAYVFVRNGPTTWVEQSVLFASNRAGTTGTASERDSFGNAVAISGDTLVIGAYREDSSATGVNGTPNELAAESGAAYVFVLSYGVWTEQAFLKASNTGAGDWFGISVGIFGDTVVVGASRESSSATGVSGNQADNSFSYSGAVYVFARSGTTWAQQAYLKASNTGAGDWFGNAVAIAGDTLVVGAPLEASSATGLNGDQASNSKSNSGAAYAFTRDGTTWAQQAYVKASILSSGQFGTCISISGETMIVASPQYSAAYVFYNEGGDWVEKSILRSVSVTGFGKSVAVSGNLAIVGANLEKSSTTGINSTPNTSAPEAGAAYTFGLPPEIAVQSQAGTNLVDGASSIPFGAVNVGGSETVTFTIRNYGADTLTLGTITIDGANPEAFSLDTTSMPPALAAGGTTTFTVTFTLGAESSPAASLHIASNDDDESLFDITLAGQTLSYSLDSDSDGVSDAAERDLATLGFDWKVGQAALVATLRTKANGADLYTTSQIQALNVGTPLLQRNNLGQFLLTIGVEKSVNLQPGSFSPFALDSPGSATSINNGKLEFQFTVPDDSAFFRLKSE